MQTDRVGLAAVAPCWATCSWPAWWRSAAGQLAFRLRAQGLLVGAGLVAAGDVRPSWQQPAAGPSACWPCRPAACAPPGYPIHGRVWLVPSKKFQKKTIFTKRRMHVWNIK